MSIVAKQAIEALHLLQHSDTLTDAQAMEVSLFADRIRGWERRNAHLPSRPCLRCAPDQHCPHPRRYAREGDRS